MTVGVEMFFGFGEVALGLFQIFVQLLRALLRMLNSLLDAGNIAANFIEPRLYLIERITVVGKLGAQFFNTGVACAPLGNYFF